jgi:hypothetical protein
VAFRVSRTAFLGRFERPITGQRSKPVHWQRDLAPAPQVPALNFLPHPRRGEAPLTTPTFTNLAEEAKALWMALASPIASSMLAGDLCADHHAMGDLPRALCQARIAIGESSMSMALAIDVRESLPQWVPVADAIIGGVKLHIAFLEDEVDALIRRAKLSTGMSRNERKAFTKLGECWTSAIVAAREIVAAASGDPDDLPTLDDLYRALLRATLPTLSLLRRN